ncbi:MAG: MBOAT family protein, partial [Oscillospiraceae bacterium]
MVFSSLTFLFAFLPITLILYYIVPDKAKNVVILISGLVFYAWGEPLYVLVMIASTAIDYTAGRIIHAYDDKPKIRTICLIVSLVMNLGLLGVFKYLGFIIESLNSFFGLAIPNPNLPLPIGISFFTFQSMSYT